MAGEFQEDRVTSGRQFQRSRSVAKEFVVNENFCAVRLRSNRYGAHTFGSARGRRVKSLGGWGILAGHLLNRGLRRCPARGRPPWIEGIEKFETVGGPECGSESA